MRATEFITELFQPGKNWQWAFRGSEEVVAEFQVGEILYRFTAYAGSKDGVPSKIWEVEFGNMSKGQSTRTKFGLTGTGNSAEVLSTVIDIMREFLKLYQGKVSTLIFSAKEDSRQGLYAKMIKRLLPKWTMEREGQTFILHAPANQIKSAISNTGDFNPEKHDITLEDAVQDYTEYNAEYNGLDMTVQLNNRTNNLTVMAYDDGQFVGQVLFKTHGGTKLYPWQLEVKPEFRGKGIAKTMYDFLKAQGLTVQRSTYQTPAGSGFWDKHRGKAATVWENQMNPPEFTSASSLDDVKSLWNSLGIDSFIFEKNGTISLSQIIVPKSQRKSGIGTTAMQALTDYADKTNQRIVLSPSSDFGGSVPRLIQFYKRFGFVSNKGRNKDFTTSETMIRLPR